ncbi:MULTISPECIES: L-threonylcarbamoyladenylate synthase [Butyricimonas]|uniref:L-threonylcarbamoyladenylate synthase n=1 Tax=Butyricimonas TaxID=574697 RepID=UPI002082C179|nr:L-threonylcarbamoyladenylate synthase [Butyricimonas paravirosa]BDF56432.1 threonylcarbamoyl-AMP synthase [Odoribacteraceae bacterium]GKH95296.1 threonylcarbamoyl-AMP synthase [Odoribacteraceae bacterium]GKH97920.1 threonylcarbamoyl-AMP synthase [Odoribacteraceae bacterium]GKI01285.1 threonylcarbamoyl-AMP synthase [Odoribacteraceae bacterium]
MNDEKLKEEVRKACEILKNGGIILYPTDTIWGIGCDATNEVAVKRVYELKHREDSKAMLVLLDDVGKLASYVEVPDVAYELLEVNDKPMTIIYPNAKNLAKNLIAQDRTIGIRITSEIFTKSLLYRFRKPIVSTSANISGEPSPRCFAEISDAVKTAVDYVVDFRQEETTNPAPSSIIKLGVGGEIQIIRK